MNYEVRCTHKFMKNDHILNIYKDDYVIIKLQRMVFIIMSILTSASSNSVNRGYEYYIHNKVTSLLQVNDNEYEGNVSGSLKIPYHVHINLNHPKKSYCDCPHANGNTICKHMVALYFSVYPDEAKEYREWLESDYEEDFYDEEDDYDRFHDGHHSSQFKKPLFFDEILNEYINKLSKEELRNVLKKELQNDEERTYYQYLENDYKAYINGVGPSYIYINELHERIKTALDFYDYNYTDFSKIIFTSQDKDKIKKLYKGSMMDRIDTIIMNPKLADFSNYQTLIPLIKGSNPKEKIESYIKKLLNHLDTLKHYSIRNSEPKSNTLIAIYLLSDFTVEEQALSMIKNAKYIQYIEFLIRHSDNYRLLYSTFKKEVEKKNLIGTLYLPDIFNTFILITDDYDHTLLYDYCLYAFLCKKDANAIDKIERFSEKSPKEAFIKDVTSKTQNVHILATLYSYYHEAEKLWLLLSDEKNKHLLIQHIDVLKERYSKELYDYFLNQFYATLQISKSRETYAKASTYVKAISQLHDGSQLIESIKVDLKSSQYKNCRALFAEIDVALNR